MFRDREQEGGGDLNVGIDMERGKRLSQSLWGAAFFSLMAPLTFFILLYLFAGN